MKEEELYDETKKKKVTEEEIIRSDGSLIYLLSKSRNPEARQLLLKHLFSIETIIITLCSILIFLGIIAVFIFILTLNVEAGVSGVICSIYRLKGQKEVNFGRLNPYNGKMNFVVQLSSGLSNTKKEISAIDRSGNMYWSPGNNEIYEIKTSTGEYTKKVLKLGLVVVALTVQSVSSSIYGTILNTVTGKTSVQLLYKGNNDQENFQVDTDIVTLESNPTNIATIDPANHEYVTVYKDSHGHQELLYADLYNENNKTKGHIHEHEINSISFDYQIRKLVGVSKSSEHNETINNLITIQRFDVNDTAVIHELSEIHLGEKSKENVTLSAFYHQGDKNYVAVLTTERLFVMDVRSYDVIASSFVDQFEFEAFQINSNLKF